MPTTPNRPNGQLNYWVAIDVAALALGVTERRAYKLARTDHWRATPTRPRGYLMHDINNTRLRRKK